MNSLPSISHHLFVAAIGNEGRRHEEKPQLERSFMARADQASATAFEVMDDREPIPESGSGASRVRIAQVMT